MTDRIPSVSGVDPAHAHDSNRRKTRYRTVTYSRFLQIKLVYEEEKR